MKYLCHSIILLLAFLFHSFRVYIVGEGPHWQDINPKAIDQFSKCVLLLGLLALLINVYLLAKVFSALLSGAILDVGRFKNEGDATDFYAGLLPHRVMVFSYLFSPVAYVALPLHFYYLCVRRKKEAILFLLISLLIVLSGLIYLSRSATIQYVLVYAVCFLFISPVFSRKIRKRALIIAIVSFIGIIAALSLVSTSRFSSYYTKNSLNPAILDESESPLLFSTLDYFSEWEENGPIIMRKHDLMHTYYGLYNSCGIASHFFPQKYDDIWSEMENHLGDSYNSFHGLIARLLYDFGVIGTVVFVILFAMIIRKSAPQKGALRFKTLLTLSSLLPVCVLFFSGNQLSSVYLNIGIVYCVLFYMAVKKRLPIISTAKMSSSSEKQISSSFHECL